jgi:hypothetical protein
MSKKQDIYYYKDGTTSKNYCWTKALHRIDGPAAEYASGGREWWIDGKRHRIGGPAIEHSDGGREWWVDGKLHRVDGPAVEYISGTKSWYIDGKSFTNKEFDDLIKQVNEMSLTMKLTDPRWWVRELGEREVG